MRLDFPRLLELIQFDSCQSDLIPIGSIPFDVSRLNDSMKIMLTCFNLVRFDSSLWGCIVDAIQFVVIWLGSLVGFRLLGRVIAFGFLA